MGNNGVFFKRLSYSAIVKGFWNFTQIKVKWTCARCGTLSLDSLVLKLNVNIIATSHHMHLETSSSFWKNSKFKMHLLSGLYLAWDFSDIFSAEINKHDLDKHMHKEINRINVWECYIFELYEQKSSCHYFPFIKIIRTRHLLPWISECYWAIPPFCTSLHC